MILRLILGALVSTAALVAAIYTSGGTVAPLPTAAAAAFVVIAPLGAALAAFGAAGTLGAFRSACSSRLRSLDEAEAGAADAAFVLLSRATAAAAALGFLLIQIMTMYDLEDPSAIGAHLGYSLSPAVIGAVVAACLYAPLRHSISRKALAAAFEAPSAAAGKAGDGSATRSRLRFLLGAGLALAAVSVIYVAFWGGRLFPLLNPPSVIMMLFFPLGNALAGPGPSGIAVSLGALRQGDYGSASVAGLRYAKASFRYLAASSMASGGIAFLTGAAYFLQGLGDRMRYGPTMALALVSLAIAALFSLCVGLPLKAAACSRLAVLDKRP
ncbi:MAG: hypothetical protein KKA67_12075 [Spirochaetes bacterium]|nr:hypothetical protein [Spirochaetota bacterium]MBU1080712.1 hypothetical protein [Spirochaetota bacterium]